MKIRVYLRTSGQLVNTFGTNGPAFLAYEYDGVFQDAAEVAANKIDYSAAEGSLRPGDMKFKDISGPDG